MSQQKYNAFLQSLKQWITDNQADFDEFEAMMANEPEQGYFSILQQSAIYLPMLKGMAAKKLNSKDDVELSDVIKEAETSELAKKLLATFDNKKDIPFIPAMLCWLYCGRSFEGMIEFGEKIIDNPQTSWLERIKTLSMIKIVIWFSKTLKIRTSQDWEEYYRLRKVFGDTKSLDWAMERDEQSNMGRRVTSAKPIIEFVSDKFNQRQKQSIVKMVADYMGDNTVDVARHVATMITALEYHKYFKSYTKRSLYESLKAELNVNIGSETLINDYLNSNNYDKNLKETEIERAIYNTTPN